MTAISTPDLVGTAAAANRRQWLVAGGWLAVVVAAMIAMFWEAAAGAFRVWRGSETFNHCFLIAPIVAYLLWDRRAVFSTIAPRPSRWLLAVLPVPVFAWLVGDIAAVLELQQFAGMAVLQVAIAAIIGLTAYRALLFPCLYLFLLVPTGEWLTPPLQDLTTWFVVTGLELLSIPVYADGVFIDIPNGRFEVAEACAGLRFLIASIAFGFLFAILVYRSWGRRVVFIGLSFVVPLIANGLRAFGIVYVAYLSDNQIAVGIDHIVYGWGFFTAILLLLIWIGLRYREDERAVVVAPAWIGRAAPASGRQFAIVTVAALVLISSGSASARYLNAQDNFDATISRAGPEAQPPWRQVQWTSSWRPVYVGATAEVAQSYSDTSNTVDFFAAVYASQGPERKLIGFHNRLEDGETWHRVYDDVATLPLDGADRRVLMRRLDGPEGTRFVWWIYWIDGHWTASTAEARVRYVLGKLMHGRSTAAVVVLSAAGTSEGVAGDAVRLFLRSLPELATSITAFNGRPETIDRTVAPSRWR